MSAEAPPDPARCPLCAGENRCQIAAGHSTCWCFDTPVPAEVLVRVPEAARGVACVCAGCAKGPPEETPPADEAPHADDATPAGARRARALRWIKR